MFKELKSFAQTVEGTRSVLPIYRLIREKRAFVHDGDKFDLDLNLLEAIGGPFLEVTKNPSTAVNLWLDMNIYLDGPKVFRPTLDQCLALEQIQIRLKIEEYAQPFPFMIVEYPEEYRRLRRVQGFDFGNKKVIHHPVFTSVGHSSGLIWLSTNFSSGTAGVKVIKPKAEEIEADLPMGVGDDLSPGITITTDEDTIMAAAHRLTLNAMLLLMEQGCRRVGPDNPAYFVRLEKYLDKAKKRKKGVEEAELNLVSHPIAYALERPIVLTQREAYRPERGGGGGTHPTPHWRRGHWRNQAHGPGFSLHKRILIKPVLIGGHTPDEIQTYTVQ